jgi:hypothetical protein
MPVETDQLPLSDIVISSSSNPKAKHPWAKQGASAIASSSKPRDGMDWQAFSAAYFPGRRRHDLEAIVAYGKSRRADSTQDHAPEVPTPVETDYDHRIRVTALRGWEDEGGA